MITHPLSPEILPLIIGIYHAPSLLHIAKINLKSKNFTFFKFLFIQNLSLQKSCSPRHVLMLTMPKSGVESGPHSEYFFRTDFKFVFSGHNFFEKRNKYFPKKLGKLFLFGRGGGLGYLVTIFETQRCLTTKTCVTF